VDRWEGAAAALKHPRGDLHRLLATAELRPKEVLGAAEDLVSAGDQAGPEWGVDVRRVLLASAPGDPRSSRWREQANGTIERYGLGVFRDDGIVAAGSGAVG
jgi:hypothetical protein